MTLGAKIRESRRKQGLSQEQLADKLAVSRSAVAKWETDKGLPDVGNLKILARLLKVSVDHLLDDEESALVREPYLLVDYGYGCKSLIKNRVVRDRFPEAAIYALMGQPDPECMDAQSAAAPDCRTLPQNPAKPTDRSFYLVESGESRLFVTVTDAFIEIRPLELSLPDNRFTVNGWHFIKHNYEIQE